LNRARCFTCGASATFVALVAMAACARSQQHRINRLIDANDCTPIVSSLSPSDQFARSLSTEAWTFEGQRGLLLKTPHHHLHTTLTDAARAERLVSLMESMLAVYRGMFQSDTTTLPLPNGPMPIFLLRDRGQWERQTRQTLGEQAAPLLAMPRGGFAIGGRIIMYDLGQRDTAALLAHEGWHQYVQTTFKGVLPAWLDEGIATVMEGHHWEIVRGTAIAAPVFNTWANTERFDELRRVVERRGLWTLDRLIIGHTPMSTTHDDALAYYAQAWALTLFLLQGQGGSFREGLKSLVSDAASGEMEQRILRSMPTNATSEVTDATLQLAIFRAYFGPISEVEPAYFAFISRLTRPGAREVIVRGESPFP